MKLLGFLEEKAVVLDMQARTKEEAVRELIQELVKQGGISEADKDPLVKAVLEREARGSTGLGEGIAITHVKDSPHVEGLTGVFGRSQEGIPFDAVDGRPVHLVFLILGGEGCASDHIGTLRKLAALRMNNHFLRFLRDAKDEDEVVDIIKEMSGSVA